MATTTDQQAALKDAMTRAKEIAAKLQKDQPSSPKGTNGTEGEETRKRALIDKAPEPAPKRNLLDGVKHDPKVVAQKVANILQQKTGLGSMLVEEVSIPNKLVGLVIGRGGEMINKLQSESGAKVQVAPDPPPDKTDGERQITITGSIEAVNKAKRIIDDIRSTGKIPERLLVGTLPGEFSVEIFIPKGKVGLVIGKGGENIKSLQERAGCKMVLFQDGEYANSPEKPLRITGEHGAVMYGKQLVQELLISKELEGMNPQDGQGYREIDVPREAVGLIIGSRGANIHQIQMETGCRIRFKNDMEGPTKTAMLSGNPQQLAIAEAKLREFISGNTGGQGAARPQFNGVGGMMPQWGGGGMMPQWGGGMMPQWGAAPGPQAAPVPPGWTPPGPRPSGSQNPNLQPGHKDVIIQVPANKCGLIIGKGGDTIKLIRTESNLNIELENNSLDPNFRIFRAQGTDEMIEKALAIIRDKTNDRSIVAKPVEGSEVPASGQNQWEASPSPWPAQPPAQNWTPDNQWGGQQQPAWGQATPNQPVAWNQQPPAAGPTWSQPQSMPQPVWDPQQQQWQQPNPAVMGQWGNPQQWTQPSQSYQPQVPNPAPQISSAPVRATNQNPTTSTSADPPQSGVTQTNVQPDYSAAWALYYQQQQQYYQQYAMQQQSAAAATAAAVPVSSVTVPSSAPTEVPGTPASTSSNPQAQAMADYQAKLAEYYKQFGVQAPQ